MIAHIAGVLAEETIEPITLCEQKVHMRIAVIGAGSMGKILARHLAKRSHHVSIANSRGPESLTALAAEIDATPVSVVDAAKGQEIVIIAIPNESGRRSSAGAVCERTEQRHRH